MTSLLLCEVTSAFFSWPSHFSINMDKIPPNKTIFDRSSRKLEDFSWSCKENFQYRFLRVLKYLQILRHSSKLSRRSLSFMRESIPTRLLCYEALLWSWVTYCKRSVLQSFGRRQWGDKVNTGIQKAIQCKVVWTCFSQCFDHLEWGTL